MEAGDTHVSPPVRGDDSYAAGRGLPPRPPYRRGGCRPRVVAASWKDDLEARFALVDRVAVSYTHLTLPTKLEV